MSGKPRAESAAKPRSIRFTAEEWALVVRLAKAAELKPSIWVRARALEER